MGLNSKNWKALTVLLLPVLVLSWSQGCSQVPFSIAEIAQPSTISQNPLIQTPGNILVDIPVNSASGNGGTYEGKLVIAHHYVPGFQCQGLSRPESVLIRQINSQWQLVQNTNEKCGAIDHENVQGVQFDETKGIVTYKGKSFEFPRPLIVDSSEPPQLPDVVTDDGICANQNGRCSLEAAIQQAVVISNFSPITVKVSSGFYNISRTLPLDLTQGAQELTIDGGAALTTVLDATKVGFLFNSIFVINARGSRVILRNMTLQNGSALGYSGGAVTSDQAQLTLDSVIIQKNNASRAGGGVSATRGSLVIKNSLLRDNNNGWTERPGEVILSSYNSLFHIENSEILDQPLGGTFGVILSSFDLSVKINGLSSTNLQSQGPVLRLQNVQQRIDIENSTMAYNNGSAVHIDCTAACLAQGVRIANSTLVDNRMNTIIAGRNLSLETAGLGSKSSLEITNSILGVSGGGTSCAATTASFFTVSTRNNLLSEGSCDFGGQGNITSSDFKLGPLTYSGGKGQSMSPLTGSPAIDAGDNLRCTSTDQRGLSRPIDRLGSGARCDIGAIELQ